MPKILKKNEEKPCSTYLKTIFPWHFQNPKPRFRLPDPSLPTDILPANSPENTFLDGHDLNWSCPKARFGLLRFGENIGIYLLAFYLKPILMWNT